MYLNNRSQVNDFGASQRGIKRKINIDFDVRPAWAGKHRSTYHDHEPDGKTDLLGLALTSYIMCNGHIRFYKRDGMSKLTDYEFFDTYLARHQRHFDGQYGRFATDTLVFSSEILQIGDMISKKW